MDRAVEQVEQPLHRLRRGAAGGDGADGRDEGEVTGEDPRGQVPRLAGRAASGTAAPLGRYAAGLAMATLATWIVYASYLMGVANLALNYQHDSFLVQGGWLAVQLVGILAAVMVVMTVACAARQAGSRGARPSGALGRACVACVVAGSLVLLVSAAYWGVYPAVL
ncbi:hypothetical protein [Georgenia sp. SUBG003]|uniref:hypothetical protein n=1 Tax=Georgenia sp. SUBG003 TaxID=1497974 RepID=UPI003AB2464F